MRHQCIPHRAGNVRFPGWFWLPLGVLVALACMVLVNDTAVMAQADGDGAPEEGAPAEPNVEVADDNVPELNDAPADAAPRRGQNYLGAIWEALGAFYSLVFLSMSFTLVALFVMNLLTARRENVVPVALVEGFENRLNEKRYQEAYELTKNDESFLGQVLSAGLAKLSSGYDQAIEAMQEVGEEENMKLEHRLSYMALIGTISPMIGLTGTVQGMISSFSKIAEPGMTPQAHELAQGIYTALYTTLLGLLIAIPAIAAYNILRNRVQRLVLEVGIVSEGLMSRFSNVGPGSGAASAAGAASGSKKP